MINPAWYSSGEWWEVVAQKHWGYLSRKLGVKTTPGRLLGSLPSIQILVNVAQVRISGPNGGRTGELETWSPDQKHQCSNRGPESDSAYNEEAHNSNTRGMPSSSGLPEHRTHIHTQCMYACTCKCMHVCTPTQNTNKGKMHYYFKVICVWVCEMGRVHTNVGSHGNLRHWIPMEWMLQVVMDFPCELWELSLDLI